MKLGLKKGQKLYSILKFKCPHCHEGEFFENRNPYHLSNMSTTHDKCPKCGRKFSMEPGFYYGAMYVSYALGVAHIVSFIVAEKIVYDQMEFWNFIYLVGFFLVLLTPLYYALSKIIWANMFFNYKGIENEKS
jgi:uncharacterized protein (DUF983 family)